MDYISYVMDTMAFECDEEYERRLDTVSEYRRNKVKRLRRRQDRNASLAAGCLLSYALRKYAGVDEKRVKYTKNKFGKPAIIEDIQFSISHTDGCVAVIVGRHPCGIDVEHVRRIPDSIVDRMYSDDDKELITHMAKNENDADLYSTCVWTRREAYGKLTGTGILMSDECQKMVMRDDFMSKHQVCLANHCIGQDDIKNLTGYVVAVAVDAHFKIPDIKVINSWDLKI